MNERENKNPPKGWLLKLAELFTKGILGGLMLFYLLWENTTLPLQKKTYEKWNMLIGLGQLTTICSMIWFGIKLFPTYSLWAVPAAVLIGILTYSHGFPMLYLVVLSPAYRFLRWALRRLQPLLRRAFKESWRFFKRLYSRLSRFVNWLSPYAKRFWNWLADCLKRFWSWLDAVLRQLWNWLAPHVKRFCT